jgi:hypothetical protein
MFLVFNSDERLPDPRQLESIQGSTLAKKSNWPALKEEEEVKDQVYSPKPVQVEKYHLPAEDHASDLNSPKQSDLSYLQTEGRKVVQASNLGKYNS